MIFRSMVALVPFLITACVSSEPVQQDRFYSLEPRVQALSTEAPPVRATLLVNDLATRGFLGGREIVYRSAEEPLQVMRYPTLLWEELPGRAVAEDLVGALRTSQLFAFVITPAQRARADYLLGGELSRFDHLPTAQPPRVVAEFTLTLMRGDDRRSMLSKRYQGEEATGQSTPEAMAQAFNRLTGRLLGEVVRDLQSLRPQLRSASTH
ncbi:MAG: ABC-type transport auxiliary lipoprotein family protein [Pseudomonadota bacterium]|nr:ABC-type transport auxiliary lipoprotein family protein [Pseudomonadota bacterium]